ncbi:protein FAM222A-like isoform X2 [Myxocyprinus asiaticus]|nr:protein FAM222A-like isoform X2 [Myxocyprinus asiaticus]XP_051540711.1 protein FAM222A-like isoform X2 [Myxocyprinus asiaticus]XP_051540712.1 protein FAM222A-like isoform X2 [Myxocyprinus asiaticus]
MRSLRYPSTAELDAYAQRTADSPLSIKIFPTNIRVPQHKQINRTVNGLDTSGQRFSPFSHPYSGGYQGLLATVRTSTATKSVLKSSDSKRTKLSPIQMAVAPYATPINHCIANRHRQVPYNVGLCKAPEAPNVPSVVMAAFAMSDCSSHRIIQQMRHPSNGQCGETHSNPSFLAATAASNAESGFAVSGYSRAVLPTQSADVTKAAGYVDGLDYRQHEQRRVQQYYPQGSLRMYSANSDSGEVISGSPKVCVPIGSTQISYRSHTLSTATSLTDGMLNKATSSPLNCTAMHGNFSVKQFFAPPWNSMLATPGRDYSSQEVGRGHPHLHPHTGHPQPYPMDRRLSLGLSCGLPSKSTCQASLLSSSLQLLECLISEIHPPCIKERMLGRDYDVVGVPQVFDHQSAHVQLPVLR